MSEEQKINQWLKQKLRLVQENIPYEDDSTINEEAQAFSLMDTILDDNDTLRSTQFHKYVSFGHVI